MALGLSPACSFSPGSPVRALDTARDLGPVELPARPDGQVDGGPGLADAAPGGLDAAARDVGEADVGPPDLGGVGGFPFPVSSVQPGLHPPGGRLVVSSGRRCRFSTDDFDFDGCEETPEPSAIQETQLASGLAIAVVSLEALAIEGVLEIRGDRGVVLLVFGDAAITGRVDASASSWRPGPGGNHPSCGARAGLAGGIAGSGGGGHSTPGGKGGAAGGSFGGTGGAPASELLELLGGCPGGGNGRFESGAGGGALQISSAGLLEVSGSIWASGGGGGGASRSGPKGGGGGGSGGTILLEARVTRFRDGTNVYAVGGGGGEGALTVGDDEESGEDGEDGSSTLDIGGAGGSSEEGGGDGGRGGGDAPPEEGEPAWTPDGTVGGGGGGGAAGRVIVRAAERCEIEGAAVLVPPPEPASICP